MRATQLVTEDLVDLARGKTSLLPATRQHLFSWCDSIPSSPVFSRATTNGTITKALIAVLAVSIGCRIRTLCPPRIASSTSVATRPSPSRLQPLPVCPSLGIPWVYLSRQLVGATNLPFCWEGFQLGLWDWTGCPWGLYPWLEVPIDKATTATGWIASQQLIWSCTSGTFMAFLFRDADGENLSYVGSGIRQLWSGTMWWKADE